MSIAYLNGVYQDLESCKVSVLDRGFIFGDAIYELIPVYAGQPFHLQEHLARLTRSLDQINIADPYQKKDWLDLINALIEKSGLANLYVYIQVTRGVAARDHAFPAQVEPTVFAMIGKWPEINENVFVDGVKAITVADMRWDRCDIKVTSLLANVLMRQQAISESAQEAIFIRDGHVLEGAATNIFVVSQGKVFTAPKNNLILPGITRNVVVNLLQENNIEFSELAPTEQQLQEAEEVWLTSSTKECLPITSINDQAVGKGKPGHLWKQIFDLFQAHKSAVATHA